MDFYVGQIVKAKAGRDKDSFFIIKELDGAYALIVDGKSRRIDSPKRKKLIHLAPMNKTAPRFATNREVKQSLSELIKSDDNKKV